QRLLDCRLLWTAHAGNPAFGTGVGERLNVPFDHDILPGAPRLAGMGKRDVIELRGCELSFASIDWRALHSHRKHPVGRWKHPNFPRLRIGDSSRSDAVTSCADCKIWPLDTAAGWLARAATRLSRPCRHARGAHGAPAPRS